MIPDFDLLQEIQNHKKNVDQNLTHFVNMVSYQHQEIYVVQKDVENVVVKVVDPVTHCELAENQTGELWINSPSVAAGYHGKPKLSEETFRATLKSPDSDTDCEKTFLRTGDLAFLQDGFLYICGRLKDLIIINGVNYYPQVRMRRG